MLKVRATLNEGLPEEEHLSLNDMLLKAAAIASEKVPDVSAPCYRLDRLVIYSEYSVTSRHTACAEKQSSCERVSCRARKTDRTGSLSALVGHAGVEDATGWRHTKNCLSPLLKAHRFGQMWALMTFQVFCFGDPRYDMSTPALCDQ